MTHKAAEAILTLEATGEENSSSIHEMSLIVLDIKKQDQQNSCITIAQSNKNKTITLKVTVQALDDIDDIHPTLEEQIIVRVHEEYCAAASLLIGQNNCASRTNQRRVYVLKFLANTFIKFLVFASLRARIYYWNPCFSFAGNLEKRSIYKTL